MGGDLRCRVTCGGFLGASDPATLLSCQIQRGRICQWRDLGHYVRTCPVRTSALASQEKHRTMRWGRAGWRRPAGHPTRLVRGVPAIGHCGHGHRDRRSWHRSRPGHADEVAASVVPEQLARRAEPAARPDHRTLLAVRAARRLSIPGRARLLPGALCPQALMARRSLPG